MEYWLAALGVGTLAFVLGLWANYKEKQQIKQKKVPD